MSTEQDQLKSGWRLKIFLSDFFNNKHHEFDDISREALIVNRLGKSHFILFSLMGLFIVTLFVMFFVDHRIITMYTGNLVIHITLFLVFLFGFFVLPYHPSHYGFNLNRLKMNLFWGILIGTIGAAVAVALRLYLLREGVSSLAFHSGRIMYNIILHATVYPLFVLFQETTARGYFQSYFIAIFDESRHKKILGIIFSSVVFAQFHLMFGVQFFVFAFLFSILLGVFYERSRSLVGVVLIHYLTGVGLFFLSK